MADLGDVEETLKTVVSGVLYPNGTGNPSVAGVDCQVYRGWPKQPDLDRDLKAGKVTVTIYPRSAGERNTTRFPRDWQMQTAPIHTMTAAVVGTVITLGGTPAAGQWVTAVIGGIPFTYAVLASDTLADIASKLGILISATFPVVASGSTITVDTGHSVVARIGAAGTSAMEVRRQVRQFQITFWCPTPQLRDLVVGKVDPVLEGMNFITLPDGFAGRLLYVGTMVSDGAQAQALYRRDLIYSVEYPTTVSETDYEITSIAENIQGAISQPDAPIITSGL
ncbi:MAG: hypothetical protein P4M09_16920 [Devosia sp.]|nr:hypothetical protein [Devosia sp.]